MSLIEDALKEYDRELLEDKKEKEKERNKLIEEGTKTIKSLFGESLKIDVVTDRQYGVAFLVDGLKMRARRERGWYSIYLVQECKKCGTEFEDHIINLKNIGKVLKEGHGVYDCDQALKAKEPKKVPDTEERFLEALRDFIAENSNIG